MTTTRNELRHEVLVSDLAPVADLTPVPDGSPALWQAMSHTLVYGPTSAALVDPPITEAQTAALADWIEARGRRLEYIYITHWHGDHWLGTGDLLQRFPHATVLAGPATARRVNDLVAEGEAPPFFTGMFPGQVSDAATEITVEEVPADGFLLDGQVLRSVEVGHSDTDDSTVLHVPSTGLVAAGDVVYNNVHQYLAETPDGGFEGWLKALDAVAALEPRYVVAGHKDARRDDAPSNIEETRRYLEATRHLLESRPTREEFFRRTLELYPERVNPYIVWLGARRLIAE